MKISEKCTVRQNGKVQVFWLLYLVHKNRVSDTYQMPDVKCLNFLFFTNKVYRGQILRINIMKVNRIYNLIIKILLICCIFFWHFLLCITP